jgi:hypothetical protein
LEFNSQLHLKIILQWPNELLESNDDDDDDADDGGGDNSNCNYCNENKKLLVVAV